MIGTSLDKDKMRKTRVGENEKGSREEQNRDIWRRSSFKRDPKSEPNPYS